MYVYTCIYIYVKRQNVFKIKCIKVSCKKQKTHFVKN